MQARTGVGPDITGIVLAMVPGDPQYGVEIWRASDSSAPGTPPTTNLYASIVTLTVPQGGQTYLDTLAMDGYRRYYQARQVSFTNANDVGPFTAATTGDTPTALNAGVAALSQHLSVYPLNRSQPFNDANYALSAANTTGNQFAATVYLPAANTINVGTTGTPASVGKTRRINGAAFVPASTVTSWVFNIMLFGISTQTGNDFVHALDFPAGVTMTNYAVTLQKGTTDLVAAITLYKNSSAFGDTALATLSLSSSETAVFVTKTAAIAETPTTAAVTYYEFLTLQGKNTIGNFAQYGNSVIDYTMPDYQKGL